MGDRGFNQGDIFVAASSHNLGQIFRVDPNSGDSSIAYSGGELEGANITAMEWDANRVLLVSTFDRILQIDTASGQQQLIANQPVIQPHLPSFWTDICRAGMGRLFATTDKPAASIEVDTQTGSTVPVQIAGMPRSLEAGPDNFIFVAIDDQIIRYDVVEQKPEVVMPEGAFCSDFVVSDEGVFYLVRGAEVIRFNPSAGKSEVVSDQGHLRNLHGIAVDASGGLLVSDLDSHSVIRIHADSGDQQLLAAGGGLANPGRIVVAP